MDARPSDERSWNVFPGLGAMMGVDSPDSMAVVSNETSASRATVAATRGAHSATEPDENEAGSRLRHRPSSSPPRPPQGHSGESSVQWKALPDVGGREVAIPGAQGDAEGNSAAAGGGSKSRPSSSIPTRWQPAGEGPAGRVAWSVYPGAGAMGVDTPDSAAALSALAAASPPSVTAKSTCQNVAGSQEAETGESRPSDGSCPMKSPAQRLQAWQPAARAAWRAFPGPTATADGGPTAAGGSGVQVSTSTAAAPTVRSLAAAASAGAAAGAAAGSAAGASLGEREAWRQLRNSVNSSPDSSPDSGPPTGPLRQLQGAEVRPEQRVGSREANAARGVVLGADERGGGAAMPRTAGTEVTEAVTPPEVLRPHRKCGVQRALRPCFDDVDSETDLEASPHPVQPSAQEGGQQGATESGAPRQIRDPAAHAGQERAGPSACTGGGNVRLEHDGVGPGMEPRALKRTRQAEEAGAAQNEDLEGSPGVSQPDAPPDLRQWLQGTSSDSSEPDGDEDSQSQRRSERRSERGRKRGAAAERSEREVPQPRVRPAAEPGLTEVPTLRSMALEAVLNHELAGDGDMQAVEDDLDADQSGLVAAAPPHEGHPEVCLHVTPAPPEVCLHVTPAPEVCLHVTLPPPEVCSACRLVPLFGATCPLRFACMSRLPALRFAYTSEDAGNVGVKVVLGN
ncbi:hypothetical protein CYMTET_33239 [Cymbomonas tetramitiformis]|uniref:Uncharacterized protein n=1 Tax=Cymbomonas tetramitiformis TaxID=36881 RepID=A0AAE0KR57_9CHLO|nr:hypothetical protein CYMTET_33239 [Cymbomonas tetramitiformis]